jgi:3-oxoacyl-[acyl-carrier protein] reductase
MALTRLAPRAQRFSMATSTAKLQGRRALVTAGAQGIGLSITRALMAAGCDVFVHYRSSREAAEAACAEAAAFGVRAACAAGDLTEADECGRIVAEAIGFLGGLDVLINNAGSMVSRRPFVEADDEFWAEVMSLNIGSLRRVTRAAVPHLVAAASSRGGASIVNLSSLAGRNGGGPGALAYSTAKGAVLTFTRGLAVDLGPKGVRVNAVTPGLILGSSFHAAHTPVENQTRIIGGIPLGRAGTTEDVARAVVYLASEYDGFITGATLDINGGVYFG